MKRIFIPALAICLTTTAAFAQKTLSTPDKTQTTSGKTQTTTVNTPSTTNTQSTTTNEQNTPTKQETMNKTVTPPDAVAAKFKSMYPNISEVKWMQNKEANYVAIYKVNDKACRTVYAADGSVKRIVTAITQKELPAAVNNFLVKNQPGKTPKNCVKIENGNGNVVYTIKFEDKMYRLDSNGTEVTMKDENADGVIDGTEEKSMK